MSINPEDINAFAGMLGKLNKIQEGKHSPKTAEEHQKAIADNDMHAILNAFHNTSGITKSALSLTEDVKQLGPETKAKDISPVLGEPEKDHPFDGYLVGDEFTEEEVEEAKAQNPYAIGMATAMKSTGDTPPLKRAQLPKHMKLQKLFKKMKA